MHKSFSYFLVAIVTLVSSNVAVNAASFDCGKASTATEKAICADPELSALDEQVARTFLLAKTISSDRDDLIDWQKTWLQQRDTLKASNSLYGFMQDYTAAMDVYLQTREKGVDYKRILERLKQIDEIIFETDKLKRVVLFKFHEEEFFSNVIIFDKNQKLKNITFGSVGFPDACLDIFEIGKFSVKFDKQTLTSRVTCNRYSSIRFFEISTDCLNEVKHSGPDGTWYLSDQHSSCLVEESDFNFENRLMNVEPKNAHNRVNKNALPHLVKFMADYVSNPVIIPLDTADVSETQSGCVAGKLAVSYARVLNLYTYLSTYRSGKGLIVSSAMETAFLSNRFRGYASDYFPNGYISRLVASYQDHPDLYKSLMHLVKIIDSDGDTKRVINDLLTYTESDTSDYFYPCENFKALDGKYERITYWRGFSPAGFWKRREEDGTKNQLQTILSDFHTILQE